MIEDSFKLARLSVDASSIVANAVSPTANKLGLFLFGKALKASIDDTTLVEALALGS